jgi:hypothetical protein
VLDHLLEGLPRTVIPFIVRVFFGMPLAIFDVSHAETPLRGSRSVST